jgi:hypothetical protein
MLQFIRDKSAGVVVKVLFLLLVVSFALWGVGDYQFMRRDQSPALSIAGEVVPTEQLRLEFQRDLDRLRRSVGDIDPDVLRQFGLATQTVERVANQSALDRAAQGLSLIVSDAVVRRRIQEDPNFLINGAFDPERLPPPAPGERPQRGALHRSDAQRCRAHRPDRRRLDRRRRAADAHPIAFTATARRSVAATRSSCLRR